MGPGQGGSAEYLPFNAALMLPATTFVPVAGS